MPATLGVLMVGLWRGPLTSQRLDPEGDLSGRHLKLCCLDSRSLCFGQVLAPSLEGLTGCFCGWCCFNLGTNELLILPDFEVGSGNADLYWDISAPNALWFFACLFVFNFFEGKGMIDESVTCSSRCSLQVVALVAARGHCKWNAGLPGPAQGSELGLRQAPKGSSSEDPGCG